MKLEEIKDIRVGQIYRNRDECFYNYSIITKINKKTIKIINIQEDKREYLIDKSKFLVFNKLIGFLNITHKIENNKLVELPKKEFEVDDVVEAIQDIDYEMCYEECNIKKGEKFIIADKPCHYCLIGLDNKERFEFCFSDLKDNFIKKGVIGIDYEIINDKLLTKE